MMAPVYILSVLLIFSVFGVDSKHIEEERVLLDDGLETLPETEVRKIEALQDINDIDDESNSRTQELVHDFNRGMSEDVDDFDDEEKEETLRRTLEAAKERLETGDNSDLYKRAITWVSAHNAKRRNVSPTAKNMKRMRSHSGLTSLAQSWANKCKFAHNPNRNVAGLTSVGENVYVGTFQFSIDRVVNAWFKERSNYIYSTNQCQGNCGHYKQLVWATSNKLGCGKKKCATVEGSSYRDAWLVVCNYSPAGNGAGRPYLRGTPCGSCPNNCINKLCKS